MMILGISKKYQRSLITKFNYDSLPYMNGLLERVSASVLKKVIRPITVLLYRAT